VADQEEVVEDKLVILSLNTVNTLLQYLASKPYAEVSELIMQVQGDARILDKNEAPQVEEDAS